ncbi:hypothetical protein N7488_012248 [Penicillium malachiteum]|nr:hypothetical protein N7488_012248 [Penicillium malachiteum]
MEPRFSSGLLQGLTSKPKKIPINSRTTRGQRLRNPSSRKPSSLRSSSSRPLSLKQVERVLHEQGANPSMAGRLVGPMKTAVETEAQNRLITEDQMRTAMAIRANSLYSRPLALVQWKSMYKEVYKAKHYQRGIENKRVMMALGKEGEALLAKIQEDCHGKFRNKWRRMSWQEKGFAWQRLAIWLMQNDPKLLMEFLIVTIEDQRRPNFTMLIDCLLYLDRFHYADWLQDWRFGDWTYQSFIESVLHPDYWPILSLPHKGIRLYIRRARSEAVLLGFETVQKRNITMRPETALCFMWRFTEFKDVDRALQALEFIPKLETPDFDLNSEGVNRHCCKLLTLDTVEDNAGERNFKILPRLLEMGVKPDRDMLNVVLSNAFKADHQLGGDILHFMKSHNYKLDSYSYLTLLNDAVTRGDRARIEAFVREITAQEDLLKNPWIASKIFHSHYIFTVKHMDGDADPSGIFYSMLDIYNNVHDIIPLRELTVVPPRYVTRSGGDKIPPSPVALYLILATYFRCQNRLVNVQRIYGRFRELAAEGHPSIAPLVETDHIYNEFLIAFRNSPRGLRSCVQLVEDMLHSSNIIDQNGKAIIAAKPTVRTWTLLMSAFIYNRQPTGANKIREMMNKHHVKFNDVTWNHIINGYANAQKIPETARAIQEMENAGFSIDPYTMKSLRYLRDPERLWVAIEELDESASKISQAVVTPTDSESPAAGKKQQYEQLIEDGLEKLGTKLKPKL